MWRVDSILTKYDKERLRQEDTTVVVYWAQRIWGLSALVSITASPRKNGQECIIVLCLVAALSENTEKNSDDRASDKLR